MNRTTRVITLSITAAAVVVGAGAAYAIAADDPDTVDGDDMQRASDAALAETGGGTITELEYDDGGYDVEVRLADGTEVDVELAGDFSVRSTDPEGADEEDDDLDDMPLGETQHQRASDAALAESGGGTVTDVEYDGSGYEVEIRLDDGSEIDVDLAADFSVINTENDDNDD
jgi:YD repeat-containing protein